MKKIKSLLTWVVICILSISSISCSAQRTFSEVSSIDGVTSVYVGKSVLNIAGMSMNLSGEDSGINISKIIKHLSSIEIVECENASISPTVKQKCENILSKYPFELITEVSEGKENVQISGVFDKDGKTVNMLLVSVQEGSELTYILMKGKIDMETLSNALN